MLRTFLGVKISATPMLGRLIANLGELGHGVRPVKPDNLHVTLKFLGDTEETQIPAIAEILESTAAGRDEFLIDIRGLGVFPHFRRPAVIWVGLDAEPLEAMADQLGSKLSKLGFEPEKRAFMPHLTVARVRGKAPFELETYVQQNLETDYGSEIVGSVELYQSELSPQGSRYTVLAQAVLGE